MTSPGRLYGLGLGPGDPELLTMKAARLLRDVPAVAFFHKKGRRGHARTIAGQFIAPDCKEIALTYPVTTEIPYAERAYNAALAPFYSASADLIASHLDGGLDLAILCEGDPLFYGSFMHLYVRLRGRYAVEIVPGVSGMSGCWTAAGLPMTWGDDVLTVLPATLTSERLCAELRDSDAAVIMKIGQRLREVREAVEQAGRMADAVYVERGTMDAERIALLRDVQDETAPYFSLVLIPGHGRRPGAPIAHAKS